MIKHFAARSPKLAAGLIYVAGYLVGSLFGMLVDYLITGVVKTGASIAIGVGFGSLALSLAQRRGLVTQPDELNRPISLFGPDGFHGHKPS